MRISDWSSDVCSSDLPEGDFVTLADHYGHVAIEAVDYSAAEITRFAGRCREHRTSVVLSLAGLEIDSQMRCAAAFLAGLFDAPREHWYPALVLVYESHLLDRQTVGTGKSVYVCVDLGGIRLIKKHKDTKILIERDNII